MPRVYIHPTIDDGPDPGHGGIHRVIVGQRATLPAFGWELADTPHEADLIACHVEVPETFLKLYGDKPIVVHNHGLYWTEYEWGQSWCYAVNQRGLDAIRVADATTAVSEWTANALRRATARPIEVIHHGIDSEEWAPHERPSDYVLWNKTRIDPVCDPRPLDLLAREMPGQQFVTTFSLDPRANTVVTGLLPYEEAKQYVRRAGAYLCTTRETFGIGTLEAMAAGVPVVGYNWGGQREIIEHGVDGWLVTPDDIEGLAEGIRWALDGREEIGARAREKAQRFTLERAGEQYARVYSEALAKRTEPTFHRWAGSELQPEPERPVKVSVVITSYNLAHFLPAAIESVFAQTMQDWELIIVDDASPDDSYEIAMRYAEQDPRVAVVRHPANRYLAAARNTGIDLACGQYVIPLDADDRLAPRTLAVLSEALDQDRRAHIVYGNVRFYEEDQETPVVYEAARRRGFDAGYSGWPVEFRLDWMLRGPGQLLPYSSMFRREVWEYTGGYRTRCRSSEDQDFFLRACSYGFTPKMVTEADTLLYTVRAGSMSSPDGAGWEEHRGWFPWAGDLGDLSLIPGGAVQDGRPIESLPMPSHDPAWVTVVIPVGPGHAKYVHDSVDSVDSQTFRDWACIVVNDSGEALPNLPSWVRVICSDPLCPDQDGDLCHSLGPAPLSWPEPRGAAAARNKGVRASRSVFFLPLDADDYLQPQALKQMVAASIANEQAIVYSDFWEDNSGEWTIWENPVYEPERLLRSGVLHAVTALTPKANWEAVGGYPEDLPWEDWAFQIHCAAKGFCSVKIAAPLFSYRKHTGLRRNDHVAHFDESKRAIMAHDFGIEGGTLLACGSCPQGRAATIAGNINFARAATRGVPPPPDEAATLVEYIGNKAGNFRLRSKVNGAIHYTFSGHHRIAWVHKDDAAVLVARGDFRLREYAPDQTPTEPAIFAARTPAMVGAQAGPSGAGPETALARAPAPATAVADTPVRPPPPRPSAPPEPQPQPASLPTAAEGPEPDPASVPAAVAVLVKDHSRQQLNDLAAEIGIEGAEVLANKTEVAQAIFAVQKMRGDFSGGPERPAGPAIPA